MTALRLCSFAIFSAGAAVSTSSCEDSATKAPSGAPADSTASPTADAGSPGSAPDAGTVVDAAPPAADAASSRYPDSGPPRSDTCGDTIVDLGEECDDGNRQNGDGCDNDCHFSCEPGPLGDQLCGDGQRCNGRETCGPDHVCQPGEPEPDGTSCGANHSCMGGLCVELNCLDGADADGDGVGDDCDVCPGSDDTADADLDTVPDGCDVCSGADDTNDTDSDGVPDGCDICSGADDTNDTDSDGVPDGCDVCSGADDTDDTDSDGVPDGCDVCPAADDSLDGDGNGIPDGCEYCSTVPPMADPPVIDGQLEPGLALFRIDDSTWVGETSMAPSDQLAEMAVAWRPDGIYVFIRVVDPTRLPPHEGDSAWCGDGLEVYLDSDGTFSSAPDYDDPGTRQLIMPAPPDDQTTVSEGSAAYHISGFNQRPWSPARVIIVPTPDGYALEGLFQAADLAFTDWALQAGDAVGLDIGVNVSKAVEPDSDAGDSCADGSGHRLGQYFLRVEPTDPVGDGHPYRNVAAFCTPTLAAP